MASRLATASSDTAASAPSGSTAVNVRARASGSGGTGRVQLGAPRACSWRRSTTRPPISRGPIRESRRRYQSASIRAVRRPGSGRARGPAPGRPPRGSRPPRTSHACVAASESSEIGIGAAGAHRLQERVELGALALVAAERDARRGPRLAPADDRDALEVVQPEDLAVGEQVERLLREPGGARGRVGDHRRGAVRCSGRLTCRSPWPGVAQAYTDSGSQPSSQLTVSTKCPPSPTNRDPSVSCRAYQLPCSSAARVHQVADRRGRDAAAEPRAGLAEQRGEAAVEPDLQPVVAGLVDGGEHVGQPGLVERERLLDEHRLARAQRTRGERGVRVVPGHDEHDVDVRVVDHGVEVGGGRGEPELALGVGRRQRRRGDDVGQRHVLALLQVRQQHRRRVVARRRRTPGAAGRRGARPAWRRSTASAPGSARVRRLRRDRHRIRRIRGS